MWLSMLEQIAKMWSEHETAVFPDGHTGKIEGVNLFMLNAEIGAMIASFVASGGHLGDYRIRKLEGFLSQLAPVVPKLASESQAYFQPLLDMGGKIIEELSKPLEEVHFNVKHK